MEKLEDICVATELPKMNSDVIHESVLVSEIKNNKRAFTEYRFMRLFLAFLIQNGINKINRNSLGNELYEFLLDEKYNRLFSALGAKGSLERYVDMEDAFQQAFATGLISTHDMHCSSNRLIFLDEEYAKKIIGQYEIEDVTLMEELVNCYVKKININ